MDTPEKAPIGTPVPKFEESPFSNFINNLSPINPSKTMNTSLTLGSLNFASPPSVFTSPHIGLQRESRFIRRHQLTDLAKLDLSSKNENKDSINEDGRNVSNSMTNSTSEVTGLQTLKDGGFSDPSHDASDLIVELSMELKYDCQSPTVKTEPGTSSCIPLLKESSRNVDGTGVTEQHTWDNLVDFLAFESPQDPATLEEHTKQSEDEQKDLLASLIIFPEDDANDLAQDQQDLSNDPVRQPNEATKLNQIHHMQDDNVNPSTGSATSETSKKFENKLLMHHGVRRRCLVFEIQGAREDVDGSQDCTSSSSPEGDNILPNNTHSTLRQRGDSLRGVRPGIGLHLNAIAKGYSILKPENCPEKKSVPSSSGSFPSPCIGSESFKTSALISSEENGIVENELLNASAFRADDDTIPSSPRKKRRLPENNGEDEACKRCNCKKSKCLKLYCECFAAGVYCAGPCACQECFNKPIHEETVLATRKLIESRNPLAFAPKVVKGINLANDLQDESNRTPASARHKRGCNCKKSNCLKKYCECFQGGVGCSIGCRCEGCKNTFGRRDGSMLLGMELAVEQDTPRKHIDQDLNPISTLPNTPLRLFRSSLSLPSSSNGKHPRLQGITSCSLLSRDGQGRSTFLRTEHKNEGYVEEFPTDGHISTSPSPKRIKSLSPNSKRISPPQSGNSDGLVRSSRKLILQSIPSFPSLGTEEELKRLLKRHSFDPHTSSKKSLLDVSGGAFG